MKVQDKLQNLKGELVVTRRRVPKFLRPLEKLGLYNTIIKLSPIVSQHKYHNLVCTIGEDTIISRFVGDTSKSGEITYLALGDNTTAPASSDTKLGNELYRKAITQRTKSGQTAQTSTYIPTNEGDGTYKEIGLFGDDASGSADSGTLYTHAAINETKNSGESVTIDYNLGFQS